MDHDDGLGSDPRQAAGRLRDAVPILLFPVRLETRFAGDELLVRIYPDDCSVDTFEPVLSEAEVEHAKTYWAAIAEAGDDEAKQRAAWRDLVAAHGSGRAEWIVTTHGPDEGSVATKRRSWTQPPTARLLPERFVFLGWAGDGPPAAVLGEPVPDGLAVGPDPSAPAEEQLQPEDGGLRVPEAMRWMVDFDAAVRVGMGLRVPLGSPAQRGFDRVLVLGLRLGDGQHPAEPGRAADDLTELLEHHRLGRRGFALVPQGTPTNNTDGVPSGLARGDDPDASFDALRAEPYPTVRDPRLKRDGQWLAEYLGIDEKAVKRAGNSGGLDQSEARAMDVALWPATLGYWMETMLAPVFDPATIDKTRRFHTGFVRGRGAVPAIRIGRQPYGILPATAYSRMSWPQEMRDPYLAGLHGLLRRVHQDWSTLAARAPSVASTGDPHQTLLDIVGLHPASVEFWQRYAQSDDEIHNRVVLSGIGFTISASVFAEFGEPGLALLRRLGYTGDNRPDLLGKLFHGTANLLSGPVVDDRPLSETDPVRAYTAAGDNYLTWLAEAAGTSLTALYRQDGFTGGPPAALLYLLLRHALQLGYHDTAVRLHENAGLLVGGSAAAKRDAAFLHIAEEAAASESRYRLLAAPQVAITGSETTLVGDYIGAVMPDLSDAGDLREQIDAVTRLAGAPTARLERALAEHLDCCTYRLDAWLQGLVHFQLELMRAPDIESGERAGGVHLGAYAWLRDVRPRAGRRTAVRLDPELTEIFDPAADPPLMRDSANQGYVQAPSLNQAVAAAVLRNGYLSDASPENRRTLAVNLTAERVRRAEAILEGVRSGQSLGALLGYQLERGLHDRHGMAEVDAFIYPLRKAFPLRADRLASTGTPPDVPIEAIEARNVVDGLALVEHVRGDAPDGYPFGLDLPDADPAQAAAIDAEVDRLRDTHDAVADLALAEGVQQAVLGNYDRVASTYDAYSRGAFPPEPQVVRTPGNGTGLTHRVAVHLPAGADPLISPVTGVPMSPRAQAEPAVNRWLITMLPPLADVGCVATYRDAATGDTASRRVSLRDLELQAADLIRLIRDEPGQAMAELDDRIVRLVRTAEDTRPDTAVTIAYTDAGSGRYAIFEVMPLIRCLRALTSLSRPLRAGDLNPPNRDAPAVVPVVDRSRIALVLDALRAADTDLVAWRTTVDALLADPARRDDVVAGFDTHVRDVTGLLARAAAFGIPQAGWGFADDAKRRIFAAVLDRCAGLADRWTTRVAECDALLTAYGTAPPEATDRDRLVLLQRAERLVSAATTAPPPADLDAYRDAVAARRDDFADRRADFAALAGTRHTDLGPLLGDVAALLPVDDFDPDGFTVTAEEDDTVRFAQDAVAVAGVVAAETGRRIEAGQALLDEHDGTADPQARAEALTAAAKALLGADFVVVPEFKLEPTAGAEIVSCLAATDLFDHLGDEDFPLDTWLYGVARVREPMRAWEDLVMLGGALTGAEPGLAALQLPFRAGDRWLGSRIAPDADLGTERLLYTAHFATPFDPAGRQCGLVVDEWTEIIPSGDTTTGLTFHHDRPNSEAPQAMLLVTPAAFTGHWRWDDVVDAVTETMDLARYRAVEPAHVDSTTYSTLLPATIAATTVNQLTISADLSLNTIAAAVRREGEV